MFIQVIVLYPGKVLIQKWNAKIMFTLAYFDPTANVYN